MCLGVGGLVGGGVGGGGGWVWGGGGGVGEMEITACVDIVRCTCVRGGYVKEWAIDSCDELNNGEMFFFLIISQTPFTPLPCRVF